MLAATVLRVAPNLEVAVVADLITSSTSVIFFFPRANEFAVSNTFLSRLSYCFIKPCTLLPLRTPASFKASNLFLNSSVSFATLLIFLKLSIKVVNLPSAS